MSIAAAPLASDLLRRIVRLQALTIAWMTVEAVVALGAAWTARSPALLGFGPDSAIELFSAITVLWRFRSKSDSAHAEKLAARVAGGLLLIRCLLSSMKFSENCREREWCLTRETCRNLRNLQKSFQAACVKVGLEIETGPKVWQYRGLLLHDLR